MWKKIINKEKINENQTIDIHPTSNVKKMVEGYEENIIHNHPIPMSRNRILLKEKAIIGYTKSYVIKYHKRISNYPLEHLNQTKKLLHIN